MKMKLHNAIVLLCVLVAGACSKDSNTPVDNIPVAASIIEVENALMDIVNDHRVAKGFSPLRFSEVVYEHAGDHNDYMISKGGINHDNFSSRASTLSASLDALMVAENVAKDYPSARAAFEGWLNSSDHKKTMEGNFTHTGISVKKDSEGTLYFTQLFVLK